MPELPEVHTIVADLKKHAPGARITGIMIEEGYKIQPDKELFQKEVQNAGINDVLRISKNIIMELENDNLILIHLAMTGRLLLRELQQPAEHHERVRFSLEGNQKHFELRFADTRKFGKVKLLKKSELENLSNRYGPEPIAEGITPELFLERLHKKNIPVKNALLDQQLISGLGNIYATDALWLAGIHPESLTRELKLQQASKLLTATREILNEGIRNRGISMSDYVDLYDNKGSQQNHFRIYKKSDCPACKTGLTYKKVGGRGTYFCENCQT